MERSRWPGMVRQLMAKTVLVVDDSASTRQTVTFVLGRSGYSVVAAIDGIDALRKIAEEPIDLIVTEVNMPNLSGVDFVEEVRKSEGCVDIPVIVLTIENDQKVRKRMKQLDCADWLEKPLKTESLLSSVESALANSGGKH
ncbi:MAG: two-component system response regulator [Desulfuromonas sp.]|nr:MAG: two-component system response regulator [Desulfuromonas sp.]